MDFIAAVKTLLSTILTSPASSISRSLITLARRISNYTRSNPSSPTAAVRSTAASPLSKFWEERTGGLHFSCIGHLQPGILGLPSSQSRGGRCVPGQPWKSTGELRLPHDFSLDSVLHFRSPVLDFPCNPSISFPSRQAFPRTCNLTVFFGSFSEPNRVFSLSFPFWEYSGVLRLPDFLLYPQRQEM